MLETAVALIVFNRPDTTARVLEVLRAVRPRRLFVIADGPRPERAGEADLCARTRDVVRGVDWDCDLSTQFADANLGMGQRTCSGIDWVLEQADEAIILEDDCLPDPTFFRFCAEMLEQYRADERVVQVSGFNPLAPWRAQRQSYHFALHGCQWGWATWRRSWQLCDFAMRDLDRPGTPARLREVTGDAEHAALILRMCGLAARGRLDTWDCQWTLGHVLRGALAVVPAVNLVANIGFSARATHTRQTLALTAGLRAGPIAFPLRPPPAVAVDREYDRKITAWRLGRPDAGVVLAGVDRQLAAGRPAAALLLAEAGLRSAAGAAPADRERLLAARTRALTSLGHPCASPGARP